MRYKNVEKFVICSPFETNALLFEAFIREIIRSLNIVVN